MVRISASAIVCVLATAVSLSVQAAAPDLPLQQIIDRNIAARGGLSAWRAVKTMSMSGTMDVGTVLPDPSKSVEDPRNPGRARRRLHPDPNKQTADAEAPQKITLPFQMDFKRPRMLRVELKVKNDTAVQVYDGAHGWKLRPYIGRHEVEAFSANELAIASEQQELDGPLVDFAAKGTKVEKVGIERIDGHDAYKLKLTLKGGQVRNLWIDAQTFLDAQIDSERRPGKRVRLTATVMGDYRTVNGLQIPFMLENRIAGLKTPQRLLVQQVSVNPPLSDARFAKPL